MGEILAVAAGGALGAVGRYLVGLMPVKGPFPVPTLLVNLAGAVLIGFVAGLSGRGALGGRGTLFWKTGVCGGFTTFSAFSLETWRFFEQGAYLRGGLYALLSVALCLLGVAAGQWLSRGIPRA